MNVTLVVVDGKVDKRQLEIRLPARLGRSRQADVTIAHSFISRMHCELREHEGGILLTDLGSLNGTFLADRRVRRVVLRLGDQFSIGPLTFELRCCMPEQSSSGRPPGEESEAADRAIELSDPLEPEPVELDEGLEIAGSGRHGPHLPVQKDFAARQKRTLPGFLLRAEEEWDDSEQVESSPREAGETIGIDAAHGDLSGRASRFDAPTRQGEEAKPGSEGKPSAGSQRKTQGEE